MKMELLLVSGICFDGDGEFFLKVDEEEGW